MISLLLFITALVICIIVVVLLILDAMKTQKYFEIQQQFDKYNLHLTETNDGNIVEKTNNNNNNTNGNNSSNNSKKVNMDDYVLKSKLKPSIKCPDMDDYVKKTDISSYPEPTDMSNYIHKNNIDKYAKPISAPLFDYKSMWHDAADAFNKHFKSHFNKMMEKKDELVVAINKTAKKYMTNPKPKNNVKTNTKQVKTNTKKVKNPNNAGKQPTINNASYDMNSNNNETNTYSLPIIDNKLRPANSLMGNGLSHKKTDSCYYY